VHQLIFSAANVSIELIPKEHWDAPSWIDEELFQESARILQENDIQYGSMKSYHQMCRWNSGLFYKHPALANTQFYWRVEPNVHFFCDVDYDVFRYMADHNKTYGFTINLYDAPQSIPTLWPETTKFIAQHPEYLHENNAMNWLTDSARRPEHNMRANGYSTCHFWSNFEITSTIWIGLEGFSMRGGVMLLCIVLHWDYLRTPVRFIGKHISPFFNSIDLR
jgi:mannosyltransferase